MPEALCSTKASSPLRSTPAPTSVALYTRDGDGRRFDNLVTTTSAPVSIDFGDDRMYVAGATTVDSFVIADDTVEWRDGTTALDLTGGGAPPNGSAAQLGVVSDACS